MTMTNAEWMIKQGHKFSTLHCYSKESDTIYKIVLDDTRIGEVQSNESCFKALEKWLDMEHVEPILDDAEKRYLKGVISPFRKKIKYIAKMRYDKSDFIFMRVGTSSLSMPYFDIGTMYKGMEPGHKYTLKELGL